MGVYRVSQTLSQCEKHSYQDAEMQKRLLGNFKAADGNSQGGRDEARGRSWLKRHRSVRKPNQSERSPLLGANPTSNGDVDQRFGLKVRAEHQVVEILPRSACPITKGDDHRFPWLQVRLVQGNV